MLFQDPRLKDAERQVVGRIEEIRRQLNYALRQSKRWTGLLRRSSLARAVQASNSIEGLNATLEDVIAAAAGDSPLDTEAEAWDATIGYQKAMTYVLQLSDDPHFTYSEALVRGLHYMLLDYDLTKHPGRWRPGLVYVRRDPPGEIVYEGPDAEHVPGLMNELVAALNEPSELPAIIRAAMAHLNLVMIHPFSDGNGRMARILQSLVLAREGILAPEFCSIEEYIDRNTLDYYAVLGEVGAGHWHPERDARPWLRFALTAHYRQAATLLRRTREYARIWLRLEDEVKRRQLPERTLLALVDAAVGLRVRNSNYRSAAEISENLASRDLKLLVDAGLLVPRGERRGRVYVAADPVREIRGQSVESGAVDDPFAPETLFSPGLAPS